MIETIMFKDTNYVDVNVLERMGMISESSSFFKGLNEKNKLMVVKDDDWKFMDYYASVNEASVAPWIVSEKDDRLGKMDFLNDKKFMKLVQVNHITKKMGRIQKNTVH